MSSFLIQAIFLVIAPSVIVSKEVTGLCDQNHELIVRHAFKIGDYVVLNGQVLKEGSTEKINTTIRTLYYPKSDPSAEDKSENYHHFFETEVWTQLDDKIEYLLSAKKSSIEYTFSANKISGILENQKNSELAFIAIKDNIFALDLDVDRSSPSEPPSFDVTNAHEVFIPDQDIDDTKLLSIKFLLLHFPSDIVKIDAILVFDRIREDKEDVNFYHSLVYTTELFEEKEYHFRHYMRSTPHKYTDRDERFQFENRMEWTFDENNQNCEQLLTRVTGVSIIEKIQSVTSIGLEDNLVGNESTGGIAIKFAEFYGSHHQMLVLKMDSKSEKWSLSSDQNRLDNYQTFVHCKQHPEHHYLPKIICDKDYGPDSEEVNKLVGAQAVGDEQNYYKNDFWLWLGILTSILGIILLIAFGIYLFIDGKVSKQSEKQNPKK